MIQGAGQFGQRFGSVSGGELGFDAIEFAVGFYNLWNVCPLALQQKENAGQAIEQFTGQYAPRLLAGMKILMQHKQIVAEIQKGFARTLVGECGAPDVKNAGPRT